MSRAIKAALDYAAPIPPYTPNTFSQLKREFIRNTAVQAVAMAFFTGISCYYSDRRELRIEFFKQAVVVLGVSAVGRALALRGRYRAIIDRGMYRRVLSLVADCLVPFWIAMNYTQFIPVIKAGGHYLSAVLLLNKTENLTVIANATQDWQIGFGYSLFSPLGELLGETYGLKFFYAAGAVTSVAARTIALMIALHDMAGELSKFLFCAASYSLITEFLIGSAGGIHSSLRASAIAAIPIIITAAFLHQRKRATKIARDFLDYASPLPLPSKELSLSLRNEFIKNTATHAVAITSIAGLSCYFATNNELRMEYIQNGVTLFAACTMARAFATLVRYAAIINQGLPVRMVSYGADCIAPFYFSLRSNLHALIVHEVGHILAQLALLKNAKIEVVAHSTRWITLGNGTGLTKLGNRLGMQNSLNVINAGGSAATVAASTFALIASTYFNKRELAKTLFFAGFISLIREVNYAQTALTIKSDNPIYTHHDFVALWKDGGVHPYLAIATMIALPVISTLGFLGLRYRNQGFFHKPDGASIV